LNAPMRPPTGLVVKAIPAAERSGQSAALHLLTMSSSQRLWVRWYSARLGTGRDGEVGSIINCRNSAKNAARVAKYSDLRIRVEAYCNLCGI
jgi:hypothetical protein